MGAAVPLFYLVFTPLVVLIAAALVGLLVYPIPIFLCLRIFRRYPGLGKVGLFLLLAVPLPLLAWVAQRQIAVLLLTSFDGLVSARDTASIIAMWMVMNLPMLMALAGIAAGIVAVRIDRRRTSKGVA